MSTHYLTDNPPSVYARIIINSQYPHNPTGLAYYDSSLPSDEKSAESYDIYIATSDTVYSAVYMSQ
jgi:aspartate/methionine/tyrosine aminotransferase